MWCHAYPMAGIEPAGDHLVVEVGVTLVDTGVQDGNRDGVLVLPGCPQAVHRRLWEVPLLFGHLVGVWETAVVVVAARMRCVRPVVVSDLPTPGRHAHGEHAVFVCQQLT